MESSHCHIKLYRHLDIQHACNKTQFRTLTEKVHLYFWKMTNAVQTQVSQTILKKEKNKQASLSLYFQAFTYHSQTVQQGGPRGNSGSVSNTEHCSTSQVLFSLGKEGQVLKGVYDISSWKQDYNFKKVFLCIHSQLSWVD